MRRFLVRWGPAVLWAAAIFLLSSRSTVPAPRVVGFDKVMHFGAYAVLGFLLARGRLSFAVTALLGLAYGASDEIHQMFVPGRFPSVLDWVADALGVLAGIYVHNRWRARRPGPSAPAGGAADFART